MFCITFNYEIPFHPLFPPISNNHSTSGEDLKKTQVSKL